MLGMAYVYKWTHKHSLNWYIGVRTSKKGFPGDNYICSSKKLKPLIEQNLCDWEKEIIASGTAEEMLFLEQELLTAADARHDPRSFNLHNSDMKYTRTGIGWNGKRAGENNPNFGKSCSDETKEKIRQKAFGRPRLDLVGKKRPEHAEKMRIAMTGRKHSEETRLKLSLAAKNRKKKC